MILLLIIWCLLAWLVAFLTGKALHNRNRYD